jgi:uncharacterized membrane protein YbaN (DUF454 family)
MDKVDSGASRRCVTEPAQGGGVYPSLEIEFDETARSVRVYDPRLFQAGRRRFCERLLKAATHQPGIKKAEIDLASASCQIEFAPGSLTPQSMADSFVCAVRGASAGSSLVHRLRSWRRRAQWSTLTAFRLPEGVALWETLAAAPSGIRLRRPGIAGNRARLSRMADAVADLDGVEACRVSPWSHRITIDVSLDGPLSNEFLDTVEQALACLNATELLAPDNREIVPFVEAGAATDVSPSTGARRLFYLAMAGGAFSLTLVGLMVPGIPTVPFLLATSYYLARSSPAMNDRLRRTSFFGPIIREWEQYGGLSQLSKGKLTALTLAIVGVTIVLVPLTPIAFAVIVLVSSLSIYGITRMPSAAEKPLAISLRPSPALSLP